MKEFTKHELNKALSSAESIMDVAEQLGYSRNINSRTRELIKRSYEDSGIDLKEELRKKFKVIRTCPVCSKEFETPRYKPSKTCSYGCSNTYFRSGEDNPNWNPDAYRSTCFLYHEKKCVVCGEFNIVEVHHLDENKENNSPNNLVPLCPTHHQYWHSRYRHLVEDVVRSYILARFA